MSESGLRGVVMVRTNSLMVPLGTRAPDFALPETKGDVVRRDHFKGKPLLVMFICQHCPYVKHVRKRLAEATRGYMKRGVAVVGINSNDAEKYPDDGFLPMVQEKEQIGYPFPYLYDETQKVAKAYKAMCTPDFFLYDKDHRLYYRGQFDRSRPDSGIPVTGEDLTAAVDALLAGDRPPEEQMPSMGCNIKWRPGNEPDYLG
jgi:peroxiredoxin